MTHAFAELDGSTLFYLALYVATMVLHVVFMQYTFAGTIVVAVAAVRRRFAPGAQRDIVALVARDWLPMAVSAAITAGIAPLLFVQLVYQQAFYTANLLLFNRWMAILPVLIAAIYAMYLVKAKHVDDARVRFHRVVRPAAAVATAVLVAYVALAFVENHLVSLAPAKWTEMYANRRSMLTSPDVWVRLAMWAVASLPVFAACAAWQLRLGACGADDADRTTASRALAVIALAGLVGDLVAAAAYGAIAPAFRAAAQGEALATGVALLGVALAVFAWARVLRARVLARTMLVLAGVGSLATIAGMTVVREAMRIAALSGTSSAPHAPPASGGFAVFVLFALIGIAVIAWIVREVARALARGELVSDRG